MSATIEFAVSKNGPMLSRALEDVIVSIISYLPSVAFLFLNGRHFTPSLYQSATQPFLISSRNAPRCVTTLKTAVQQTKPPHKGLYLCTSTSHSHARPQTNSSAKMPMIGSLYFSVFFVKKVKYKLKRKRLHQEDKLQSGTTIHYKVRGSSRH